MFKRVVTAVTKRVVILEVSPMIHRISTWLASLTSRIANYRRALSDWRLISRIKKETGMTRIMTEGLIGSISKHVGRQISVESD